MYSENKMPLLARLKMCLFPHSLRSFHKFAHIQEQRMAEVKAKFAQQEQDLKQLYEIVCELSGKIDEKLSTEEFDRKMEIQEQSIAELRQIIEDHFWQINYNKLMRGVQKSISTAFLHQKSFAGYKNKYAGKTVVLCGAGPTLNYYEPIEGTIHIAVNRAFLFDKVKFDYIFAQDFRAIAHLQKELKDYKGNNCVKFFGTEENTDGGEIPESFAIQCNAVRYNSDFYASDSRTENFALQLDAVPTGSFWSTAFPAIQFAIFTNPAKIYIVGCDTSIHGHFTARNLTAEQENKMKAENWQVMKLNKIGCYLKSMCLFITLILRYFP